MSVLRMDTERSWDIEFLQGAGFLGFRSMSHLLRTGCLEVPVERGVYVVVRDSERRQEFLARSVGGWFRQQDPSVTVDVLKERWVEGAQVLYLGRARGPGVRSLLQQRVKRYIRFGQGKAVAHAGGRFIWQLRDHMALKVAWLPTPDKDPAILEAALLEGFYLLYERLPFANRRQEHAQ